MSALPPVPDGAIVYQHPQQGKTVYVLPDGTMQCWKADGKRATTSATPAKLAAGHGAWEVVGDPAAPPPLIEPQAEETVPPAAAAVRIPMTYGVAEVDALRPLAMQDDVVIEQKLDGTRALAVIDATGGKAAHVRFLGRNGQTLKHAAAAQHFRALIPTLATLFPVGESGEIVLDGEILSDDGTFWIFDLPYMRIGGGIEFVQPGDRFSERRRYLETVAAELAKVPANNVRIVHQARTAREKHDLIARVEETGAEGVMVKHIASPYEPGKRAVHSLKVKYVRTADVVVLARDTDGAKNATLGVAVHGRLEVGDVKIDSYMLRPIGNCSMIGKPDAQVGDVVEVKYLYLGSGGRLYQPRLERLRPDREPASCTMEQFVAYSKAVLA